MPSQDLKACQEKLAQLQKEYDDFIYLVSHDLKAPIRAINNLSEWIEEDLGPDIPADAKNNMFLLRDRAQRLDKMLAAILELSRVSRMNLQVETIALTPFIHKIKDNFSHDQVTFYVPDDLPMLTTYVQKLQTVIEQIFDNALKHNPDKDLQIEINGLEDNQNLKLEISDNGSGILPEQAEKIFNLFYTGQDKKGNTFIGSGLTLSKKIVDFVGGSLTVKENLPTGSTFILHWPLKILQNS
jgi:signal transduction histidine kinase